VGHFFGHIPPVRFDGRTRGGPFGVRPCIFFGKEVRLKTILYIDGFQGRYDAAIVISGDSDLCTPIKMVRSALKKPIGVLNPQRTSGPDARKPRKSAGLKKAATFYQNSLTWAQLAASQFPATLTDSVGTFTKPASW